MQIKAARPQSPLPRSHFVPQPGIGSPSASVPTGSESVTGLVALQATPSRSDLGTQSASSGFSGGGAQAEGRVPLDLPGAGGGVGGG